MGTSKKQSKLYSFYKAVVTVPAFMACFYLLIVCFVATYRLVGDIGYVRILFLNPVFILLIALLLVFAAGLYILKNPKMVNAFGKFDDKDMFKRAMAILKILIFAECLAFSFGINDMGQRVDQLEIQNAAYSFSWGETEAFIPPGYLGICPNNIGMAVFVYLLSTVTGHYNNLFIMLLNGVMVPFIYSDLANIGGKFGLSKKSQVLIMICGLVFLPIQAKTMIVYGEIPGLFLAVRAMKHAASIAHEKNSVKSSIIVISFMGFACILKNNFLIYAIAITIFLAAELMRQKRFKELFIPAGVMAASVLFIFLMNVIIGVIIGRAISSGESSWAYVAMGMQEEGGMFNGYNAATYEYAGFNTAVQSEIAKADIAESFKTFCSEPNYAIGFYTRKALIQWSDPTHCTFEFLSRNVYLDNNSSPLIWYFASPVTVRVIASFLKVFQVLMFAGGAVSAVKIGRRKQGSPALLLLLTFVGGYIFHLIWESSPFYTLSYMTVMIPAGVAGLTALIKKLSEVKIKELSRARIQIGAGILYFIAGTLVFFFAAAGLGTLKNQLADGRKEYNVYFGEILDQSRNPVQEGIYYLKPATEDYEGEGIKIELIRYAGKFRMRVVDSSENDNVFITCENSIIKVDWFSYGGNQVFAILRNNNGTYMLSPGERRAVMTDTATGKWCTSEFMDYTFQFNTDEYNNFIAENPNYTWRLEPAS